MERLMGSLYAGFASSKLRFLLKNASAVVIARRDRVNLLHKHIFASGNRI